MNSRIRDEVQLLKLYLRRFPQQAAELAVAYLEDYLVLISEFERLRDQVEQLRSDPTSVPQYPFVEAQLTLEQQFRVETFKRSFLENQGQAEFWAIAYFYNFLLLAESYRQAEAEFDLLSDRLLASDQPQLPNFL